MIFIIVMLVGMLGCWAYCNDWDGRSRRSLERRNNNKALPSGPKLSDMSQRILQSYKELPVEHRFGDITAMLHALDVKHDLGEGKVNHFWYWNGWDYSWRWNCGCASLKECPYGDYKELRLKIRKIKDELSEKERLIKVAEVQGDLDALGSLRQHLDNERAALVESNQSIKATITIMEV